MKRSKKSASTPSAPNFNPSFPADDKGIALAILAPLRLVIVDPLAFGVGANPDFLRLMLSKATEVKVAPVREDTWEGERFSQVGFEKEEAVPHVNALGSKKDLVPLDRKDR